MNEKEQPADHNTKEQEVNKEQEVQEVNETEETADDTSTLPDLAAELEAANDKYLRLYAEFDNYKRRTSKERVELIQSAGKDVIINLLSVLDDFDRALKAMESATEVAPVKEGLLLVSQKFKKILAQQGLKEMESIGKPFDAELQEAITNIPAPNDELKGKVIDEIEKGYYLNDKVLRHAKVVVGN